MSPHRLLQMSGILVDVVYRVDSVPAPGGEAIVHGCNIYVGGGFNAMIAASRAGLDVAYGGAHGTGVFGDKTREALRGNGIPILQTRSKDADQGSCVVLIDKNAERTFIAKNERLWLSLPRVLVLRP